MFKMQDLKKAVAIVADNCGIDSREAARVIGLFNTGRVDGVQVCEPSHDTIADILAGDVSGVPAACAVLGIDYKDKAPAGAVAGSVAAPGSASDKIPVSSKKRNTSQNKKAATTKNTSQAREAGPVVESVHTVSGSGVNSDIVPAASAEVVTDNGNGLPEGYADSVREWLETWAESENIDLNKLHAQQWRAGCMFLGQKIKQSHVLNDDKWIHTHGGRGYSGERLEGLLALWAYLCGKYKQVPLVFDFVSFSGVSRSYFYDYDGRGLSSTSVQILKKARAIEESGLGSSVAGGGAGAVGGMFLLKTRHGYSETVTIQHSASAPAVGVAELPLLGVNDNKK